MRSGVLKKNSETFITLTKLLYPEVLNKVVQCTRFGIQYLPECALDQPVALESSVHPVSAQKPHHPIAKVPANTNAMYYTVPTQLCLTQSPNGEIAQHGPVQTGATSVHGSLTTLLSEQVVC